MSTADLEQLYVMRVTLEAEAVRLSVPRMTQDDLARLEGHMAEMAHYASIKDYRRWVVPHEPVSPRLDRARRTSVSTTRWPNSSTMPSAIAACTSGTARPPGQPPVTARSSTPCKAEDRDLSAGLLASHLARTGLEVSELLDPSYRPELLERAVTDVGGELPRRTRPRRQARAG